MERVLCLLNFIKDPLDRIRFMKQAWPACDDLYDYQASIRWASASLGYPEDFLEVLDADEKAWIESCGEPFQIYRGCAEDRIDGLSWTTDRTIAESFAVGHRGISVLSPVIVSAKCSLENILFVTNDREEYEVVVDPMWHEDVWVEPFLGH